MKKKPILRQRNQPASQGMLMRLRSEFKTRSFENRNYLEFKIETNTSQLSARIDEVEAKLSARIDEVETKLSTRIDELGCKIDSINTKISSLLFLIEKRDNENQIVFDKLTQVSDKQEVIEAKVKKIENYL